MSGLSGTQGCTHIHTHRNTCIKPPHTGDSSGGTRCVLSFAWLPHTSAECQLSFLFCTWRRWGNDEGNKNTKQQKRSATMPLSSRHLLPLSPSLHPPLPLSLSLCAPPTPPSTFTLPHRISLSSALESSSVSAHTHAEVHSEKTWRKKASGMSPQ